MTFPTRAFALKYKARKVVNAISVESTLHEHFRELDRNGVWKQSSFACAGASYCVNSTFTIPQARMMEFDQKDEISCWLDRRGYMTLRACILKRMDTRDHSYISCACNDIGDILIMSTPLYVGQIPPAPLLTLISPRLHLLWCLYFIAAFVAVVITGIIGLLATAVFKRDEDLLDDLLEEHPDHPELFDFAAGILYIDAAIAAGVEPDCKDFVANLGLAEQRRGEDENQKKPAGSRRGNLNNIGQSMRNMRSFFSGSRPKLESAETKVALPHAASGQGKAHDLFNRLSSDERYGRRFKMSRWVEKQNTQLRLRVNVVHPAVRKGCWFPEYNKFDWLGGRANVVQGYRLENDVENVSFDIPDSLPGTPAPPFAPLPLWEEEARGENLHTDVYVSDGVPNITFAMDGARGAYEAELRYTSSATSSPRPASSFDPSKVLKGPATATPRPDSAVTVGSVRASWKPEPIVRHRWISGDSRHAKAPPLPSPSKEPPDFLDRAGLFAPIPAVGREKPRDARSAAAEAVGPRVLVERLITRDSSAMRGGAVTPPPRTKWTRRVPRPVLIGHAASLTPYG